MTTKLNENFYQMIDEIKSKPIKISQFKSLYKICDVIGKGSYGCVYSGVRLWDQMTVAIKHIDKHRVIDWRYIKSKRQKYSLKIPVEIYLMDKLKDIPGIIQLLDWYHTEYSFLIIMERPLNSVDLFEFKKSKHNFVFSDFEINAIFKQLLQTLDNCLKRGVVHRDIKPENILINTESLVIQLIDFGAGGYSSENLKEHFRGTIQYCSPEYLLHKTLFGELQLVWSLGILLYELKSGDIPYENEDQIINNKIILKIPENVFKEYKQLIQKCLSRNPLRRPSIKELLSNKLFDC